MLDGCSDKHEFVTANIIMRRNMHYLFMWRIRYNTYMRESNYGHWVYWLKLLSLISHNIVASTVEEVAWVTVRVPRCNYSDYPAWFAHKPSYIDSIPLALALVTLDCCASSMRDRLKSRLGYLKCPRIVLADFLWYKSLRIQTLLRIKIWTPLEWKHMERLASFLMPTMKSWWYR